MHFPLTAGSKWLLHEWLAFAVFILKTTHNYVGSRYRYRNSYTLHAHTVADKLGHLETLILYAVIAAGLAFSYLLHVRLPTSKFRVSSPRTGHPGIRRIPCLRILSTGVWYTNYIYSSTFRSIKATRIPE